MPMAIAKTRTPYPAFRNFILKLTGFCNLNCSYCYMFNSLDRTHTGMPRHMSVATAIATLRRIDAHLKDAESRAGHISLHGGEPSLWPVDSFRALLAEIGRLRENGLSFDVSMQTNLWQRPKAELLELLVEHDVGLGVSLDGPRATNDANRFDFAGHGTHDRVLANVDWMIARGFKNLLRGFLCVMQPRIEPEEFLEWLSSLPVTRIDLLWPIEFNLNHVPWADGGEAGYASAPLFGEWAARLYEAWWRLDRPELDIRLFTDALDSQIGVARSTDVFGARSFGSIVVDTDGSIELADYFRTSKDGGCRTGYSVLHHDFDTVRRDARFARLRMAAERVPQACRSCRHVRMCSGGALSGRLDASGELSARPSVLCHDHMRFFDTVAGRLEEERTQGCKKKSPARGARGQRRSESAIVRAS